MKPSTDRIAFQPQQCLARTDLVQASQRAADLLALHAARGHGVWGVVTGYLCQLDAVSVVVGPGVALDRCGRPLLTPAQRRLAAPPVPADGTAYVVDLVACWAPTAELFDGCRSTGAPAERARLRWELAGPAPASAHTAVAYSPRVRLGIDVPIARLTATASAPRTVDTGSRPVAHSLVRPKIATGHVQQLSVQATGSWSDWQIPVSTASAGFDPGSSPVYLVGLDAHPFGDTSPIGLVTGGADELPDLATRLSQWAGPFVAITTKDHAGFTMRVVTATGPGWARDHQPGSNPVPVSWIGIDTADPGPFAGWWPFFLQFATSVVI